MLFLKCLGDYVPKHILTNKHRFAESQSLVSLSFMLANKSYGKRKKTNPLKTN